VDLVGPFKHGSYMKRGTLALVWHLAEKMGGCYGCK